MHEKKIQKTSNKALIITDISYLKTIHSRDSLFRTCDIATIITSILSPPFVISMKVLWLCRSARRERKWESFRWSRRFEVTSLPSVPMEGYNVRCAFDLCFIGDLCRPMDFERYCSYRDLNFQCMCSRMLSGLNYTEISVIFDEQIFEI